MPPPNDSRLRIIAIRLSNIRRFDRYASSAVDVAGSAGMPWPISALTMLLLLEVISFGRTKYRLHWRA